MWWWMPAGRDMRLTPGYHQHHQHQQHHQHYRYYYYYYGMFCLMAAAQVRSSGELCECPCPSPPLRALTEAPDARSCCQHDGRFRYRCVEGFTRKAGTSNLTRCRKTWNGIEWSATNLQCIPIPKTDQPAHHTTDHPAQRTTHLPVPQTTIRPAQQTTDRPVPQTTVRPAQQTTDRPVPQTTVRPAHKTSDRPGHQITQKTTHHPSRQTSDRPGHQTTQKTTNGPAHQTTLDLASVPVDNPPPVSSGPISKLPNPTPARPVEEAPGTLTTDAAPAAPITSGAASKPAGAESFKPNQPDTQHGPGPVVPWLGVLGALILCCSAGLGFFLWRRRLRNWDLRPPGEEQLPMRPVVGAAPEPAS